MYLKITQGSKEEDLRKINHFVLKIFEYAARSAQFDKKELTQMLEQEKVWTKDTYTPTKGFYQRVGKLFGFSQEERENIYEVMQHDMEFDRHIEEPSFVFGEVRLSKEQKDVIKGVTLYLYDNLFRKGKFEIQGQRIGYQEFKDSLFEHNSTSICPACLSFQTDLKMYGEVDHYFPKKDYPAITFQPMNLAVICSECNDVMVKGQKDPSAGNSPKEFYFPYLRAAEEETELKVKRTEGGEQWAVGMIPSGSGDNVLINKRIRNLDNLFDLSLRWTKRMDTIIEKGLELMEEESSQEEVEKELHAKAERLKKKAVKDKTVLLNSLVFAHIEKEGKRSFLAEWKMRRDEKKRMEKF